MPNIKSGKRRTWMSFWALFKGEKTKYQIVVVLFKKGPKKGNVGEKKRGGDAVAKHGGFLERERLTSL